MTVTHHQDIVFSTVPGHRPLALDLYVGDQPRAVCVYLHGGGWRMGSRRNGPGPVGPASQRFFRQMAERGLAVASVDYRLTGEAIYPAQLDDVVAAVEFLSGLTDDGPTDSVRELPLGVWGVSAGAHLASLAALASSVADRISAVVAWSGPSDLLALADDLDAAGGTAERGADSRESLLVGATLESVPERARAASPLAKVRATSTPFHIVHGLADEHIPIAQSERFATALAAAGVSVTSHWVEGANHFYSTIDDAMLTSLVDESIDIALAAVER